MNSLDKNHLIDREDKIDSSFIDALIQAIDGADICVTYQNTQLSYLWAKNLPDFLSCEVMKVRKCE